MSPRRVVILFESGLAAQGLRSLLAADSRLEVAAVTEDLAAAAALLRECKPDALVVEGDKFPLYLGDPPHSVRLDRVPLVISLASNENRMQVLQVEERALTALQELIETLAAQGQQA